MRFTSEAISSQINSQLWGLERWIGKLQKGYPVIWDDIEAIISQEALFPLQWESPTGFNNLTNPAYTGWETPFTNEEWDVLFHEEHYPFPDEFRQRKEMTDAVRTARNIQALILGSNDYQELSNRISDLPALTEESFDNPRWRYINWELREYWGVDFSNINIWMILWMSRLRLRQIAYSVVESRYQDDIISKIWIPMIKIRDEIMEQISTGNEYE